MHNNKFYPILSVCIPTYNRGELLNKLLKQIYNLNAATKFKIQICISDNFSSDSTPDVISDWVHKLGIINIRQNSNIGGSRNFQAVTRLATAPWILIMGDDDLLSVQGFEGLLILLETVPPNTWVLADICNQDGTTLLEKFPSGYWSKQEFQKQILFHPLLDSLGFMSMHVIPRDSIKKFSLLCIEQIYGWPHLALLFYELSNINIYLYEDCIVKRGGDNIEVTQTWRSNDWLRLMMQKTKLCCYSETGKNMVSTGIAIREYLRLPYARQIFHTKLILGESGELLSQANDYINSTNIHECAKLLLRIYVFMLISFPVKMIYLVWRLKNKNSVDFIKDEKVNDLTDGIGRGL